MHFKNLFTRERQNYKKYIYKEKTQYHENLFFDKGLHACQRSTIRKCLSWVFFEEDLYDKVLSWCANTLVGGFMKRAINDCYTETVFSIVFLLFLLPIIKKNHSKTYFKTFFFICGGGATPFPPQLATPQLLFNVNDQFIHLTLTPTFVSRSWVHFLNFFSILFFSWFFRNFMIFFLLILKFFW